MNQNNNNINKQQLSQEELQRTQVLNLKDIEETIRIEKLTSKKPAIIIAIIGAVSILFGTSFGVVQTLTKSPTKDSSTTQKRQEIVKEDQLNCTYNQLGSADGTDQIFNVVYTFKDSKLTKFVRKTTITPTAGNPIGPTTINSYKNAFPAYLVTLKGYEVSISPSGDGIAATTTVDYSKLDLSTFPETQQATPYTKIEYAAGTEKTNVQTDMTTKGYTCN